MLYPNPVKKNINLKFNDYYYGVISIKIYSIHGKLLKSLVENKLATEVEYSVPVDNLAKGSCLVKISKSNAEENRKIIVE